ncbi:cupin domain-containing protein [Streptomyces sp. NBC_00631]|uniref:JmjC domain-containing protein n=1 Tax=Streptomyces sp. NBC_00631 TaxID=2975793 RepID=UPI0030E3B512
MQAQHGCSPHAAAARFLAGLGPAVLPGIKLTPERLRHVSGAFDAEMIESMVLPVAEGKAPSQTVALMDGVDFERNTRLDAVALAYQERPRTRVYESLHLRSDGWFSLVTLHLAGMLSRHVICTAYESQAGDRNLGAHDDQWLGVVVQMRGAKRWLVWTSKGSDPEEITMRAGEVLILPQGMTHEVTTPDHPGHSVHLLFAVTDHPAHPRPERDQLPLGGAE